ncbi:MAG: hypothetical protein ACRCSR_03030 [Bacteroidales bacterium]
MSSIVEGLFASNSFLSKSFNADQYVQNGKIVHIPNAGAASGTKKNRTELPASVSKRDDIDITFPLDEFTTDPVFIANADTVELSYDKRTSVLRQDKLKLHDDVALDFIFKWSPSAAGCVATTGAEIDAYTDKATGKRKSLCKADVLALMTKFNNEDIPQEGRYLLLDAQMYSQLLNSLTENENTAFLASADAQNGVIGKLFSFNVMMRSKAALYTAAKAPKDWATTGQATDLAAALAWHDQSVCRALGEIKAFENEGDATYYGDIYSFLVRAGGRIMREDKKGVVALVQGVPVS